jgi:TPR repeat protein
LNQNAGLQKGIKYLRKARELGCPKASLNLGKCYLSGTGVPLNLEQARVLFKEATELGEMQGRLEYLRSYIGTNLEEEGTMNELAETGRMLLVENRNNPEALFMMGLLEEKGIGMAPNK